MKTRLLTATLVALLIVAALLLFVRPVNRGEHAVVVYTSVDTEYALPLFERFTKETGIPVESRTDSEATKTAGMTQRLLQLKSHPDGDVFWNSELSNTTLLANAAALQPYASPHAADIPPQYRGPKDLFTGFGCRVRVIVYNTRLVKREDVPATLEGLADPRWKGKFAIAKPLFGTTQSHLASLVLALGEEKAFALFRAWRDNGIVIAQSNGDVRNRVADGICLIGLTDNDDALAAMEHNKPVDFIVPDQTAAWPGKYLIPNTVAMLKNCPHPREAQAFIDYLLKPETEIWLADQGARQIPVRKLETKLPASLRDLPPAQVDIERLATELRPLSERIYRILTGEEQ